MWNLPIENIPLGIIILRELENDLYYKYFRKAIRQFYHPSSVDIKSPTLNTCLIICKFIYIQAACDLLVGNLVWAHCEKF